MNRDARLEDITIEKVDDETYTIRGMVTGRKLSNWNTGRSYWSPLHYRQGTTQTYYCYKGNFNNSESWQFLVDNWKTLKKCEIYYFNEAEDRDGNVNNEDKSYAYCIMELRTGSFI